jgi:hypothetical protein
MNVSELPNDRTEPTPLRRILVTGTEHRSWIRTAASLRAQRHGPKQRMPRLNVYNSSVQQLFWRFSDATEREMC